MSTDLFAQTGILHHTLHELNNRFCGRTFIMSRPGFLMSQYMEMLFPMQPKRASNGSMMTMTDKTVNVDVMTAEKREFTSQGMMGGMGMGMGMGVSCLSQFVLFRDSSHDIFAFFHVEIYSNLNLDDERNALHGVRKSLSSHLI